MLERLTNAFTKMTINPHKGEKYSGLSESGAIVSITIDEIAGFQNGTPAFDITDETGAKTKINKTDLVSLIMTQKLTKI
jgi:hypothetical protein